MIINTLEAFYFDDNLQAVGVKQRTFRERLVPYIFIAKRLKMIFFIRFPLKPKNTRPWLYISL